MMLPEMTFKIWDGDADEYFRPIDMNRLAYNANLMARDAGVAQVTFIEVDQSQQFRYDEIQRLENLTKAIGDAVGVAVTIEESWGTSRTVSYVDFERIESNLFAIYQAMGGVGSRIASDKFKIIVNATLFGNAWLGSGPYYIDLDLPFYHDGADAMVWVNHRATDAQRYHEMVGRLKTSVISDRVIRVSALGMRPRVDIPLRIKKGVLDMNQVITLDKDDWVGDGPWTQDVTISSSATDAILGVYESNTDSQVNAYVEGKIFVSAISGTTVTVRCIGDKPDIDLPLMLMWNATEEV